VASSPPSLANIDLDMLHDPLAPIRLTPPLFLGVMLRVFSLANNDRIDLTIRCAFVSNCSRFCCWEEEDDDDMDDDVEVDNGGEEWVESSPLDIGAVGNEGSIWRLPIDLNLSFAILEFPFSFLLF